MVVRMEGRQTGAIAMAVRPTTRTPWYRRPGAKVRLVTYLILIPVCLVWIYPFLWMVSASLKPNGKIFSGLGFIPTQPRWGNYVHAWTEANMGLYFFNTVVVTASSVLIVVATTSAMGYVLGRKQFPGKKILIGFLGALVFLPQGYTIIPIYNLINALHLEGSRLGIILAESGTSNIVQLLLYAGFFRQLPKEFEESAAVDGAGYFRTFFQIFLPLAKPVTATVIITQFIASWNSFLIPLILTLPRPELRTLAVGVYSFQGENLTSYSDMAAASTISLVPVIIVFLFLQRYFVEGVAGAVKQ